MTPEDRALLAEIAERDRRHLDRRYSDRDDEWTLVWDRRELLRIVGQQERELSDRADAAAEAEFLRPIGPGR